MLFNLLLVLTGLVTVLSFGNAPYPNELILQHLPTPFSIAGIYWLHKRSVFSQTSLYFLLVFLWLHILGARWIYSFVPYDDWTLALFGFELSEQFGWTRNHYDRLVHLASGLLFTPVLVELQSAKTESGKRLLPYANAFAWVLAIGAVYEVFEWQLAVYMSPRAAESYNGQQGDLWDAQKDLALAAIGSIVACFLLFASIKFRGRKQIAS